MKHLLIDANNLLYRAYYVSALEDKKGNRTSGVYGVMRMTKGLIQKYKPDSVVIAWDIGKSKERILMYPEYKAQRDKNRKPEDKVQLQWSREKLQKIFRWLPVKQVMVQDVEADDVIGWLCEKLKGKKIIISNDQDFIQLVKDRTVLYLPNKEKLLTKNNVDKFLGFPVQYYTLWKSMVGDTSDNIKGISGIGPKKATAIVLNGLTGKKKLPINRQESQILDRNKYLIAIGALLTKKQLKEIRTSYITEKNKFKGKDKNGQDKRPRYEFVKNEFARMDFQQLFVYFDQWKYPFEKLHRGNK